MTATRRLRVARLAFAVHAGARLDSVFYVESIPYHWHTLERT